jgi:hypothetical protein
MRGMAPSNFHPRISELNWTSTQPKLIDIKHQDQKLQFRSELLAETKINHSAIVTRKLSTQNWQKKDVITGVTSGFRLK